MRERTPSPAANGPAPGRDRAPIVERADGTVHQAREGAARVPAVPPPPSEPPRVEQPRVERPRKDDTPAVPGTPPAGGPASGATPPEGPRRPAARKAAGSRSKSAAASRTRLLADGAGHEDAARLKEALAAFVDGPPEAVATAEEVTRRVTRLVADALETRRGELEERHRAAGADTEQLRQTLLGYRSFVNDLLSL